MFREIGAPHHRPHFHVYYQDSVAVYALDPIELIGGFLPSRQRSLVEEWAALHLTELMEDWRLLQAGQRPAPIDPLE